MLALGPLGHAAGQPALAQQVTAAADQAAVAYAQGDFDKMKKLLLKAHSLGKDALATHPVMARVYLQFGVLYIDGLDNRAVGLRYFAKALKIQPDITVKSNMATKPVMSAFAEASQQANPDDEAPRPAPATAARKPPPPPAEDEPERRPARTASAAGAAERCRGDAELADVKRQARDELDRLEKALSMAKDALKKESAEAEKFRTEKMELERGLGEAKQRVTQLESEIKQRDKRATATAQREKAERDAKESLEKEKSEKDSLILDTAQRIAQLEKETAEKDKVIAAALQREKKERELREKLEHDRDSNEARDRERKAWEERVRAERDKLEIVPPVPAKVAEPLHCAVPEEIQGGADLFVRCVTQPTIKAKTIVFYYRPPSSTVYNALVMDPTRQGWSRAVITANKLNSKALQYYAEARDGSDSVAATNGKASSPNVVSIAPARTFSK